MRKLVSTRPNRSMTQPSSGVMVPPMNQFSAQGYDLQWGTNVLGPYLLTKLLLPTLETTAASASPKDPVRIIDISSSMHLLTINTGPNVICYDTLKGDSKTRTQMGDRALYSQTKSGNILLSNARARVLKNPNIISICVHPGMNTLRKPALRTHSDNRTRRIRPAPS